MLTECFNKSSSLAFLKGNGNTKERDDEEEATQS